jgi:hypothetical protein
MMWCACGLGQLQPAARQQSKHVSQSKVQQTRITTLMLVTPDLAWL